MSNVYAYERALRLRARGTDLETIRDYLSMITTRNERNEIIAALARRTSPTQALAA